ncbi:MAG: hypothetical protein ABSC57_03065 [Syntrophales bacterium]|jgi:hypothetical protein
MKRIEVGRTVAVLAKDSVISLIFSRREKDDPCHVDDRSHEVDGGGPAPNPSPQLSLRQGR